MDNGRVVRILLSTFFLADSSGNQMQTGTTAYSFDHTTIVGTDTTDVFDTASAGQAVSASYYDGAERLRLLQRSAWFFDSHANLRRRTTMAEYLYDALGRRILVRTRKDGGCGAGDPGASVDLDCVQAIERFVWDGSQRLLELRDWGDTAQTLTGALNQDGTSSYYFYGQVRYTNLAAVDAPVLVAKQGVATFVPQANWAGVYEDGTVVTGSLGYTWPGLQQDFYMEADARFSPIYPNGWYGDVLNATGGADPAGTVYFRNRYYDPLAGQFTQADPVGLAGGLNVYGYANGDPVNSRDPFGLCPPADDNYANCAAGSSEWYAGRMARGEGNSVVNNLGGLAATCAESISCMTSLIPGTVVGAAVGRIAGALGIAERAIGNVSVEIGSEIESQIAGKLWTGNGATAIRAGRGAGEVIGSVSADGTRVFREAAVKGAGNVNAGKTAANLVNKATGGNTHMIIPPFIPW